MKKIAKKKKNIFVLILVLLVASVPLAYRHIAISKIPTVSDDIPYEIRGVDVSSYQGKIDWQVLSEQNIAFAFIKATEGSSHVDKNFATNWTGAQETHLRIGAYHFMSFETSGDKQAKNFISNVPKTKNMLPPVIDVEYYGEFEQSRPTKEQVHAILDPLLEALEKEYGQKPIIYTSTHVYENYISGKYDNDIWIADPEMSSTLPDDKEWIFCQYSFYGTMDGYSGGIEHIDLNVFRGSKEDFFNY